MEFMTHLFRFFIFFIGFHGWIGGILAYRITHGISRNFDRWPMACALYMLLLFLSRRFRRWRRFFFVGDYFVPQISQIYTDFSLCGLFCPIDFTDIHRFFFVGIILSRRFRRWRRFFFVGHIPIPGGICTDRIGRLSENPWLIASAGKPPNKLRVIRWIKNLRHLRDKKTSQEKSVYICGICGTFSTLSGYLHRPNRSPLRKSVSNRLIKNISE